MTTSGKTLTKLRRRLARAAVALTALVALAAVVAPAASAIEFTPTDGVPAWQNDAFGNPDRQAGSHPDASGGFRVVTQDPSDPESFPVEAPHRFLIELPPGLIANPSAAGYCPITGLKGAANGNASACPVDSQVGIAYIGAEGKEGQPPGKAPLYNVPPPDGTSAMFAFNFLGVVVRLTPTLRPNDYGITLDSGTISQGIVIPQVEVVFWGVPSDAAHNPLRYGPLAGGAFYYPPAEPTSPRQAFVSSPTSCPGTPETQTGRIDGWKSIGTFATQSVTADPKGVPFISTGCDRVPFEPTIEARPTTDLGESPSGLDVDLHVPQNTDPDGLAEANVKDVSMTLPAGMTVNPSSANGLGACSPEEIGLTTPVGQARAIFNGEPATCPDSSKLGTVAVETPLIDHPLKGAIYLAEQNQNPFNSLLGLYISVEDPQTGITIKLAGQPKPDPVTGQLTIDFDQNPQLPFEDLKVNLFTGPRAALKTPAACGTFATTTTIVPWTSPEGANANPSDSFAIAKGAGGGACVNSESGAPNKPTFTAGTVEPTAGASSPFVLKVAREDGTQPIKAIDATLPKGLLGRLAGIPYCSDAALAAAAGKSGKAEQAAPSCPAASRVGTVSVAAGAGSTPFYASGAAYLAGPYKGAPLSLAIVTPAVAGPFDLGDVVVRTALNVDPESTQIHAVSDPIPTILQGIPLDIRSIAVTLDRPSFTLNPTSCAPSAIVGSVTSVFDQAAGVSSPFQVGGCAALPFKPSLSLALKGATKRIGHPALKAVLTAGPGEANIGRAQVNLPHGEFLDQGNLNKTCTKPVLLAGQCPPSTVYGRATAWTPLLDQPLEGNVYLVGGYGYKLPALVADLDGQIRVLLVGKIDSGPNKGIRSTFESVPDAPVSKFVLEMKGGKKYGLLENSEDLCKAGPAKRRALVSLTGQNGKVEESRPTVGNQCGKKKAKKAKGKGSGKRSRSGR